MANIYTPNSFIFGSSILKKKSIAQDVPVVSSVANVGRVVRSDVIVSDVVVPTVNIAFSFN